MARRTLKQNGTLPGCFPRKRPGHFPPTACPAPSLELPSLAWEVSGLILKFGVWRRPPAGARRSRHEGALASGERWRAGSASAVAVRRRRTPVMAGAARPVPGFRCAPTIGALPLGSSMARIGRRCSAAAARVARRRARPLGSCRDRVRELLLCKRRPGRRMAKGKRTHEGTARRANRRIPTRWGFRNSQAFRGFAPGMSRLLAGLWGACRSLAFAAVEHAGTLVSSSADPARRTASHGRQGARELDRRNHPGFGRSGKRASLLSFYEAAH